MSTIWLPLLVLALLVAGAGWWWWRHLQSADQAARASRSTAGSVPGGSGHSVAGSQPQSAMVLGSVERKAYRLLREAFPRAEVLAHVQLLRFIRLPPREQRESWLQGAGALDVDLLLCDGRFRVLAAVDVRTRRDTPSGQQRNEQMARVLQAAGIPVHVWHEENLPSVTDIRSSIAPALAARKAQAKAAEALKAAAGLAPMAAGATAASPSVLPAPIVTAVAAGTAVPAVPAVPFVSSMPSVPSVPSAAPARTLPSAARPFRAAAPAADHSAMLGRGDSG